MLQVDQLHVQTQLVDMFQTRLELISNLVLNMTPFIGVFRRHAAEHLSLRRFVEVPESILRRGTENFSRLQASIGSSDDLNAAFEFIASAKTKHAERPHRPISNNIFRHWLASSTGGRES